MKKKKVALINLDEYKHLFKGGQEGLDAFVHELEKLRAADPEGIVHVMDGDENIFDINFKIPKWAYDAMPRHRKIDAEWNPQFDE